MSGPSAHQGRYEVDPSIKVEWEVMRAQLRQRRISQGLTQTDVSGAMGRSQDFVSVLENQNSAPNVLTLMLWVTVLGGRLVTDFT